MKIRDLLKGKISGKEKEFLKTSFDIVGDVAIIEIPEELEKKEKEIAKALKKVHKHIKTVCRKMSKREGKYRLRKFKIILGSKTETIHKEHGCKFKMDISKVYFSPRESQERQKTAEKIKSGEIVMVMFAGIGPYPIIIAKKNKNVKKIYAIEMNSKAFEYMKENIRINKVGDKVIPILGSVDEKCPEYFGKCDRILMPLPKGSHEFLSLAINCLKKGKGWIHFYYWAPEDGFKEAEEMVKGTVRNLGRKVKKIEIRKILPYKPKVWKICMDIEIR
ncbi:MAG: class I SAM-dependent methyltransferase family protein [Candidatus Aenigmarchaeota archaeon]|nr:class I SAM-dependent methyltransferase family protein [Candidatus Aenigmarchaeota archaeon]NIQ18013.1 class I SAM-dependent methyltransferase family protein [Candidatus Aenigmarchaeota archaeon]